jgi:chromosome segregation ATPase
VRGRADNPLTRVIDRLKKEFSEYETAYSDPLMDFQITGLDRLLSSEGKVGPILSGLEKENNLLRGELGTLEKQLSNTVSICEQILQENAELKAVVRGKNEDIAKIIETVALNQTEQAEAAEEKNRLLAQENSMLLQHLEEARNDSARQAQRDAQLELQQAALARKTDEARKQLADSLARERELARKVALLEQSLYQTTEEAQQLQQTRQTLTFENNELRNQLQIAQGRSEAAGSQQLRRQLENEYEPILEEHKMLKKERTQLLREAERLKLEKEQLEDTLAQQQQLANKLNGDLDLTAQLLADQKTRAATLAHSLARAEAKLNELKDEANRLRAERETAGTYAVTREKRLLQEIDELRRTLEEKQAEVEARMREIRASMQSLIDSKDNELRKLREENLELQRILERR